MTENEAIEVLKDFGKQVSVKADGAYQSTIGEKACDIAIKALKEIQKYRKIEKDLKENYHANVDIPLLMKHFIETVFKGEKHEGFCILTNEDKEAWEEYKAIGTPEECRAAMEKQNVNKELESHDEKHTLECCISLMQKMVNEFAEWYRWQHGEDAIEELDEEERFCFRKSYFSIVQELFLIGTNPSGGTSTRAKCEQLCVDSAEEIEFDWSDEE